MNLHHQFAVRRAGKSILARSKELEGSTEERDIKELELLHHHDVEGETIVGIVEQSLLDVSVINYRHTPGRKSGDYYFNFSFDHIPCHSKIIHIPEGKDRTGLVTCSGCGGVLCTFEQLERYSNWVAYEELRVARLGMWEIV